MNRRLCLSLLWTAVLLSACSNVPSWVIPEKKMEQTLFDLHLAEAEIENNYAQFRDSTRKQQLFDAVFQKHGISKAMFDTSLVWYASNLDKYLAIYDRISAGYSQLKDTLNIRIQRQNELEARAKRLWQQDSTFSLQPLAFENRYVFRLDTSSYFAAGDMYELSCRVWGVNKSSAPKVVFCWRGGDTCLVKRTEISENGLFKLYIKGVPGIATHSLSGSIGIRTGAAGSSLLIDDMYLYKYKAGSHPEIKEPEAKKADAAAPDSSLSLKPKELKNLRRELNFRQSEKQ